MHLLFGQGDEVDSKVVRAALVFTEAEKEKFMDDLGSFSPRLSESGDHLLLTINGFASGSDSFSSLVKDAIREQHLHASPDFVYIEPFFNGREAALAPHGVPGKTRMNGWLFAVAVAFFGAVKYFFGRRAKLPVVKPKNAVVPTNAGTRPKAAPAGSITADSPLGRLQSKMIDSEVNSEAVAPDINPSTTVPTKKVEKKFPVKLALLAVIVVATALSPRAVGSLFPFLMIFGFWALTYFGARKINKFFADLFQNTVMRAKTKPSKPSLATPAIDPMTTGLQRESFGRKQVITSPVPAKPKPVKKDSFSDGPIRSGSGGLFGRSRKAKMVDPFQKLAEERQSY